MANTYEKYAIWIDGALIKENVSLEIMLEGDDQDVFTLTGFGQQKNKNKIMINLDNAVPTEGDSFDAWNRALTGQVTRVRVQHLGTLETLETEGFVRKPSRTSGEGKTSAQKYEFHGDAADWT